MSSSRPKPRGRRAAESRPPLLARAARLLEQRRGTRPPARHVAGLRPVQVRQQVEPTTVPLAVLLADALRTPAGVR